MKIEGPNVAYIEDVVWVGLSFEEQIQRSRKKKPRVTLVDELKVAFVTYLKCNQPQTLECQVKNLYMGKGTGFYGPLPTVQICSQLNVNVPVGKIMWVGTIIKGLKLKRLYNYYAKVGMEQRQLPLTLSFIWSRSLLNVRSFDNSV